MSPKIQNCQLKPEYSKIEYRIRGGCIFQNGFLGEVQFKKSLKKWTFQQKKKWGSIRETPQKQDFSHYLGLCSRVGLHWRGADTVGIPKLNLDFIVQFGTILLPKLQFV